MTKQSTRTELFSAVPDLAAYPAQEKYQAHLLDQYKLYVEMADRVSTRRLTANSYFSGINAALLVFVGAIISKDGGGYSWLVGIAGMALSLVWFATITSYRDLSAAKFVIIHDIEARLPLRMFDAEWTAMGRGTQPALYRPLSHIERVVPWVFMVLHLYLITRTLPWPTTGLSP